MEESNNRKYLIISLIAVCIFILTAIGAYISIKPYLDSQKKSPTSTNTQTQKEIVAKEHSFPKPAFEKWTYISESVSSLRPLSTIYQLSNSPLNQDLQSFFQPQSTVKKIGEYVVSESTTKTDASIFITHSNTSAYNLFSINGLTAPKDEAALETYLKQNKLIDDTVKITASYKRKSNPGFIYYELHRDWNLAGYPIINPFGLLNLEETQKISTLSLNSASSNVLPNSDIILSTDSKDGLEREVDFNSMTIMVNEKTGRIHQITSNLRFISNRQELGKEKFLTQSEAIERLQNNQYNLFLAIPSGKGVTNWLNVFPKNKALAKEAIIEDISLVYLEKPGMISQSSLEPYFLFKGYSNLTSGYRARFIAAVSALRSSNGFSISFSQNNAVVAGSMIAQGQQQGKLEFPSVTLSLTLTPSLIPSVTSPSLSPNTISISPPNNPTSSTPAKFNGECKKSNPFIIDEQEVVDMIEYEGLHLILKEKKLNNGDSQFLWYLTYDTVEEAQQIYNTIEQIYTKLQQLEKEGKLEKDGIQGGGWDEFPKGQKQFVIENFKNEIIQNLNYGKCELRISGKSPTLFVYGIHNQKYSVSFNFPVIYSDPPLENKQWDIIIQNSKLNVADRIADYIYYEYQSQGFTKPNKGWVIKKDELNTFVMNITERLKLNEKESARLLFELKHAIGDSNSPYLFIGLIPQSEIDQKLPITVEPKIINTFRYHFSITPLNTTNSVHVEEPHLSPIPRVRPMIIELGAMINN